MSAAHAKPIKVLLVDDDEEDYLLTHSMLEEVGKPCFDLNWVASYEAAQEALANAEHDVCLLDYHLGDRTGMELLREALGNSCQTPLIILTGKAPDEVDLEAMRAGAADYLLKNQISPELLSRSIRHAIERASILISLRELASKDPLTGLYNRREMEFVLNEEVKRYQRYNRPTTLVMMDVDHFKAVNDHYGHRAGDEVLRWLGQLLRRTVRSVDLPFRYGGEEFAIISPEMNARQAYDMAERLRRSIAGCPFISSTQDGRTVALRISVSVGVAALPSDAETGFGLLEAADHALYRAKAEGRNCTVRYSDTKEKELAGATLFSPCSPDSRG